MTAAGRDDWWVAPPHHLNYFDFESLTGLLDAAGLHVRRAHHQLSRWKPF